MKNDTWLNTDGLEEEYDIKKSTQAKLRMKRKIPHAKRGRMIYYRREKIDAWLESHSIEVA